MATRTPKTPTQPPVPVATRRSPALTWLLIGSLGVNAILASFAVLHREKLSSTERPVSAAPLRTGAAEAQKTETPLSFDLTPYAALGSFLAENNRIPALKWTEPQFNAFQRGVRASYEGHGYPMDEEGAKLRADVSTKIQAMLESAKSDPVDAYFKSLREKEGVLSTQSGLHYRITQEGSGEKPTRDSTVVASYSARMPDGKAVPSLGRVRARSAVRDLLPGLSEGVQLLNPGGKALLYLPASLSFREGPWPPDVQKGAPIIFFFELHSVEP